MILKLKRKLDRPMLLNWAKLYAVEINKYWSNEKIRKSILNKIQSLPETYQHYQKQREQGNEL